MEVEIKKIFLKCSDGGMIYDTKFQNGNGNKKCKGERYFLRQWGDRPVHFKGSLCE